VYGGGGVGGVKVSDALLQRYTVHSTPSLRVKGLLGGIHYCHIVRLAWTRNWLDGSLFIHGMDSRGIRPDQLLLRTLVTTSQVKFNSLPSDESSISVCV
jgi:hypothetical protein